MSRAEFGRQKRIAQAVRRFKAFHEKEATKVETRTVKMPDVVLTVGKCTGIMYLTDSGEQYFHEFNSKSRPQLAVSSDGKTLVLLGGAFQFTERGIVDRR